MARLPDGSVVGRWVLVAGYWLRKGANEPITDAHYILTKSVKSNLRSVVRIVSLGDG